MQVRTAQTQAGKAARQREVLRLPAPDLDSLQLPPTLPRHLLAFVGQNENGILRTLSTDLHDLLRPHGFTGQVIDMASPTWADDLRQALDGGVLLAWGAAGIGARLQSGGQSLWDLAQVPFISLLSDSPCWMPANHHVSARYVANGYVFRDWLEMQRRLVRSHQISALLPIGVIANPLRDAIPWSHRPHRMVLVKTGHAPSLHRSRWLSLPPRFRAVVEDTSAVVLQQGVCDITETYLKCLDYHDLYLEQRPDVLFGLMREVDVYVRDVRSTALVHAVLDLPVDIIGRGWDHAAKLGGKARFHPAVDAATLPELYSQTQFLLNTMPNFASSTHERVLNGFATKCCVVTNENAAMQAGFSVLPSYFGIDTESGELADQLASLYHGTEEYGERLQPALDLVTADYSAATMMRGMIDLALEVRHAAQYAAFDPA